MGDEYPATELLLKINSPLVCHQWIDMRPYSNFRKWSWSQSNWLCKRYGWWNLSGVTGLIEDGLSLMRDWSCTAVITTSVQTHVSHHPGPDASYYTSVSYFTGAEESEIDCVRFLVEKRRVQLWRRHASSLGSSGGIWNTLRGTDHILPIGVYGNHINTHFFF